jgi:lysylphosphatidylglycerol synthetase-like protein (DUF2156 family)
VAFLIITLVVFFCTPIGAWVWNALWVLAAVYGLLVVVLGIVANPWPLVQVCGLVLFACVVMDWSERWERRYRWRW